MKGVKADRLIVAILGDSMDAQRLGAALARINGLSTERWRRGADFVNYLQQQPLVRKKYQLFLLDSEQARISDVLPRFSAAPIFYFHTLPGAEQPDAVLKLLEESDIVEYQGLPGKRRLQ